MAERKQRHHKPEQPVLKLDPNAIRISEDEIRADLLYRGERPRPAGR